MLHHSIGHRIARFKAMRTRPEIAHMLFEVRHIAKLPAFHVLADFCKATFSIENQQLICKFCLRSVIAPVAIAANIFCNIVCLRKEIAIRRIALHHHRNRKERGTVVARTKQANIFCRGVRGCCRLTTPPRESLTKACSARRSAKAYAERRKHVAQCTPALASNRLVIARIFDKLHHTRGSHVCQNIHVKRIALGQVHNGIELYKRCRKTRRKFVHIITICFDSHIRRNKVDTVKIKGSIRSDDAGFVSPLGIGKPLQAIKFHNLHRRTVTERSLLSKALNGNASPAKISSIVINSRFVINRNQFAIAASVIPGNSRIGNGLGNNRIFNRTRGTENIPLRRAAHRRTALTVFGCFF